VASDLGVNASVARVVRFIFESVVRFVACASRACARRDETGELLQHQSRREFFDEVIKCCVDFSRADEAFASRLFAFDTYVDKTMSQRSKGL